MAILTNKKSKTMDKILEFETEDGTILIEVEDDVSTGGLANISDSGFTRSKKKFEEALQMVNHVSNKVISQIKKIQDSPEEVCVKLGVKFSAEAGVVIAKSSTEGNLEIAITWKKQTNANPVT